MKQTGWIRDRNSMMSFLSPLNGNSCWLSMKAFLIWYQNRKIRTKTSSMADQWWLGLFHSLMMRPKSVSIFASNILFSTLLLFTVYTILRHWLINSRISLFLLFLWLTWLPKASANARCIKCNTHHSHMVGNTCSSALLMSEPESVHEVSTSCSGVIENSFRIIVHYSIKMSDACCVTSFSGRGLYPLTAKLQEWVAPLWM